jgi:phosphomannomutase
MEIPEHIFKAYDIRGLYPEEINEENIGAIVKSIYKLLQGDSNEPIKIIISRDMRISSPSLHKVAIQTLKECGADVLDIGIVSTPTFYYSVFKYKVVGGFQISASHNPKQYNGIKIAKYSPNGLIKVGKNAGMDQIREGAIQGVEVGSTKEGEVTEIDTDELLKEEVTNALEIVGNPEIKDFKIVADPANAMGAQYIDALFKKIPGNLIRMNFELDGTFPAHQPDPLQADTLTDLKKRVLAEEADLGLAPDGDGDRLFFIDEKGEIVPASIITALVAKYLLKRYKGEKILADIRYIMTPKKVTEEQGGEFLMTRVGHAFITEKMHDEGGIFAGESSGHYYFKATGNAESQLPVILTVLQAMTEENKKLSQIVKELKRSWESGEFNFRVKNALEILEAVKQKYSDGELETLDGVAITYADWRFNIRTSNTEPLIRLNVEESDLETAGERVDELIKFIKSIAIFEEKR